MGWIKTSDAGEVSSPLSKSLGDDKVAELARAAGSKAGDCVLIAGKKLVVAGYGYCGKGVALRASGMGAKAGCLTCRR